MTKPTTVRIRPEAPRREDWIAIFGDETMPVTSPVPVRNDAPGLSDKSFYRLDVSRLTPVQRLRLVEYIARKFDIAECEVSRLLDDPEHGMPILADDVFPPTIDMRMVI
jgi:hypothetical protein